MDNIVDLADLKDDDGREERWCREGMAECSAKWQAEGKTFAWCKDEPDWSHCEVFIKKAWEDPSEPFPAEPCQITTWFSLIGGGRVGVVQRWIWWRCMDGMSRTRELSRDYPVYNVWKDEHTFLAEESVIDHRLIVQAHTADGLLQCTGNLHTMQCDIFAYAAVFDGRTPQGVADRVAKTLGAIDWEDTYYAMLDASQGCAMCGRPLRDEISQLVGVGPTCAKQHGIPHNMEAANRRLKIRREILGEQSQGTSQRGN